MPSVPTPLFINSTVPAAPSGSQNVKPQQDGGNPDSVSFYVPNIGGVDPRTAATETITVASQGKLVTLTYVTAIAVALNSGAVAAGFFCAVAVLGAGTATLTPSSGTINGVACLALSTGQGGWLFYDGVNWEAVISPPASRQFGFIMGADTAGSVLQDTDDQQDIFVNRTGSIVTIISVWANCDGGMPTIQLQKDDGAPTNMLAADLTVTAAGASTTVFVAGENILAPGDAVDFLIVAAGGVAKRISVFVDFTVN